MNNSQHATKRQRDLYESSNLEESAVELALDNAHQSAKEIACQKLGIKVGVFDTLPYAIDQYYLVDAAKRANQIVATWIEKQTINEKSAIHCYAAINILVNRSILDPTIGTRLIEDLRAALGSLLIQTSDKKQ